ncbi:MAG: adenylyl-sulfate kinase, partial [Phormidesmis sp.]
MTTTIHFVTGYHGNAGKSTVASVLEFVLSKSGRKTYVFDCDEEKQSMTKLYGEEKINNSLFSPDPELAGSADLILDQAIADHAEPVDIVVDLAADTDRFLKDWLENRG